jgi:hypothetical protein
MTRRKDAESDAIKYPPGVSEERSMQRLRDPRYEGDSRERSAFLKRKIF